MVDEDVLISHITDMQCGCMPQLHYLDYTQEAVIPLKAAMVVPAIASITHAGLVRGSSIKVVLTLGPKEVHEL